MPLHIYNDSSESLLLFELVNIYSNSTDADDADSTSTDDDLVITIDTNDGGNDDSKTLKPEDCKKDHNNNGKGQNIEIGTLYIAFNFIIHRTGLIYLF